MRYIKYTLIRIIKVVTGKTVVNLFGSTYIVSRNLVRRIR